jgi:hypothetical protein
MRRNVFYRNPGLAQCGSRSARRKYFHTLRCEASRKVDQSGLVGHGEKGAANHHKKQIVSDTERAASLGAH